MKKLFTIFTVAFTLNVNAQWVETSFPDTPIISMMKHTSEQRVWALGQASQTNARQVLITSDDGGMTYQIKDLGFLFYFNFYSFEPINDSVCVVSAGNKLYRTINGGNTWDTIATPDSIFLRRVTFLAFDELNYCLLCARQSNGFNEIYTSSDAGTTWNRVDSSSLKNYQPITNGAPSELLKLTQFENTAYIRYGLSTLMRTHDKGHTWLIGGFFWDGMRAIDTSTLIATAMQINPSADVIRKSVNGGITWQNLGDANVAKSSIYYTKPKKAESSGIVFMAGLGGAYYSTDTGNTWYFLDAEKHSFLSFYNSENGLSYYRDNTTNKSTMLKFNGVFTGINELSTLKSNAVSIYPNPATNELNIVNVRDVSFQIIDMYGKQVQQATLQNNCIDISELSKGIYYLIIENTQPKKFIKM